MNDRNQQNPDHVLQDMKHMYVHVHQNTKSNIAFQYCFASFSKLCINLGLERKLLEDC